MSKIRNSLGVIVLPIPRYGRDPLTWEQYREQTGINLYPLFRIDEMGTEFIPSKLLAISGFGSPLKGGIGESDFDVELVKRSYAEPILEDDVEVGTKVKLAAVNNGDGSDYCGIVLTRYFDGRDDPDHIGIYIN